MLSPGKHYLTIPKDRLKNLAFRAEIYEHALQDVRVQRGLMAMCAEDILFYCNLFIWQNNPKKKAGLELGPFITWPFQDRALCSEVKGKEGILWCIENQKDLVVEKSREMGATWLFLIVMDWLCRFHKFHDSLMMSKSADAVDNGTRQSLFGKLRLINEHLPSWVRGKMTDNKFFLGYLDMNSGALGMASTGRAGVSERCQEMFLDEMSQIKEDWEVYYRTAATAGCRMFNGTHLGLDTAFYQGLTTNPYVKKIVFHWTQHPDKNQGMYRHNPVLNKPEFLRYNEETDSLDFCEPYYPYPPGFVFDPSGKPSGGPHPGVRSPWYDNEFQRIHENDSEMAKDHDINPKGSISQFYSPLMIRRLKEECDDPWWEGDLTYDHETGEPKELFEMEGGPIKLWCHVRYGKPPVSFYGGGADVALGTGKTPSCLTLADGRIGKKVLEYANAHIDPKAFGVLTVALCRLFCDENEEGAYIAWEHHGPGTAFGKMVWKDLGYRNLYRRTLEHDMRETESESPGWYPGGVNKLNLHVDYRAALAGGHYLNLSERALDECLAFRHTANGSVEHSGSINTEDPSAARESHGDFVVADALSWKMIKTSMQLKEARAQSVEESDMSMLGRRRARQQKRRMLAW